MYNLMQLIDAFVKLKYELEQVWGPGKFEVHIDKTTLRMIENQARYDFPTNGIYIGFDPSTDHRMNSVVGVPVKELGKDSGLLKPPREFSQT